MNEPSFRKLFGIAVIIGLIVGWAVFVASLAPIVGTWPVYSKRLIIFSSE